MPEGVEERDVAGGVELVAYVDASREAALRALFPAVSASTVEPGWENRWRAFHRGARVGRLWIGPPWEAPPAGLETVVVDPGRAFGTGSHPTTRLCVELLAGAKRGSVLDAGCGSGVLAVVASRLGHAPVYALDSDDEAVAATAATARTNGAVVEAWRADVLHDVLPAVDLVVANIDLLTVNRLLARRPAPRAITSGYLAGERPRAHGWVSVERRELDGWAADVLEDAQREPH